MGNRENVWNFQLMYPSKSNTKISGIAEVDVSPESDSSMKNRLSFNSQLGDPQSNSVKNCGPTDEPLRKQNFRQFLRSLRESESNSNGPWLASSEDQMDAADDEGFVVAQARCKKKKKSKIFAMNNDEIASKSLEPPYDYCKKMGDSKFLEEMEKLESVFENVKVGIPEVEKAKLESQVRKPETENKCNPNQFTQDKVLSKIAKMNESSKIRNPEKTKKEKPWLYIPRTTSNRIIESKECSICFRLLLKNKIILEECGHCFHSECIRLWMKQKKTCPFCTMFSLPPDEFPRLGEIRPSIADD